MFTVRLLDLLLKLNMQSVRLCENVTMTTMTSTTTTTRVDKIKSDGKSKYE